MIDIINKTYEQYFETIKDDIYAKEGETITCQNGDYMGVFACTTYVNDDVTSLDINTDGTKLVYIPGFPDKCSVCGGQSVMFMNKHTLRYSTYVRFWMDGEWREKKYK